MEEVKLSEGREVKLRMRENGSEKVKLSLIKVKGKAKRSSFVKFLDAFPA